MAPFFAGVDTVHRLLSVTSTEGFLQRLVAATNPNSDGVRLFLLPYGRIGDSQFTFGSEKECTKLAKCGLPFQLL